MSDRPPQWESLHEQGEYVEDKRSLAAKHGDALEKEHKRKLQSAQMFLDGVLKSSALIIAVVFALIASIMEWFDKDPVQLYSLVTLCLGFAFGRRYEEKN